MPGICRSALGLHLVLVHVFRTSGLQCPRVRWWSPLKASVCWHWTSCCGPPAASRATARKWGGFGLHACIVCNLLEVLQRLMKFCDLCRTHDQYIRSVYDLSRLVYDRIMWDTQVCSPSHMPLWSLVLAFVSICADIFRITGMWCTIVVRMGGTSVRHVRLCTNSQWMSSRRGEGNSRR